MDLIWHGTAAVEAVCRQGKILFDPFVPLRGSPVSGIERVLRIIAEDIKKKHRERERFRHRCL